MTSPHVEQAEKNLNQAFDAFQQQYPEVAEAMRVMNISFQMYLDALAAMKPASSASTDASASR